MDASMIRASASVSESGLGVVGEELADLESPSATVLALHIAATGLGSTRTADVRLLLDGFDLPLALETDSWGARVEQRVVEALGLLVRKGGGWRDIDYALGAIDDLREAQAEFESAFLDEHSEEDQVGEAVRLVGMYHLAQMVTVVGDYLRTGEGSTASINARLGRHHDRAVRAFETAGFGVLAHVGDLTWVSCMELAANAIWTHIGTLGREVERFAKTLVERGRDRPVIELWPSQQEALRQSMLDPYRRAVLVEMPTSAGKTLLAKFSIVQSLALNPDGVVAYVVPTRALVNQVTNELRFDLAPMGYSVEQTVPAFELDPLENSLLNHRPNVLVTTPEKLDLLVRRAHVAVNDLVLVVVDEAHNLKEASRGARLELLLGTIKRDRPGARFLLLSPFMPNDEELVAWLGDDRALPPISVNWRPGRRVTGAAVSRGRSTQRRLVLETLNAADNVDVTPGLEIPLGAPSQGATIKALTRATVKAIASRGGTLVLCRGPGTAMTRAGELAESLPLKPELSPHARAITRYLETEFGRSSDLAAAIQHGVAYHHAGLSQEARILIESLVRDGDIDVICGTTTLAQGVNFPISSVIVESLQKGKGGRLSYTDFWNIAGRAGRALVDTVGLVAFPSPNSRKRREIDEFLAGEAEEISSQLARLVDRVDEIENEFSLRNVREFQELSPLLQFLAHALRVAGAADIAEDVEDVLRSSLVYHQLRRESEDSANKLLELCRAYLESLGDTRPGVLALADETGFTTPSVLWLLAQASDHPQLQVKASWEPSRLFGEDIQALTDAVQAVSDLPEISLSEGQGQPFNPARIARLLRDWVTGSSMADLATTYGSDEGGDKSVSQVSRYLFSTLLGQSSWGLGAVEAAFVGTNAEELGDAAYVPAMVYFGVDTPAGVWLRTVGVPRALANGLARLWQVEQRPAPESYLDLRQWVNALDDSAWANALPEGSPMTPQDARSVWTTLSGLPDQATVA
jgi:superfamily II DNA/RNA helicase